LIEIYQENQNLDINTFENKDASEFKDAIEKFIAEDLKFRDLKD
jgi:hypothetical protein